GGSTLTVASSQSVIRKSTITVRAPALLRRDVDRRPGRIPVESQSAAAAGVVVGNGEVLDRRGQLRDFHVHASQFVAFILVRDAPFACLLVDDQGPLVGVGYGEDGIAASGHSLAADIDIGAGHEGGGFVGARTPDLT